MNNGFIKLYRTMIDWEWFDDQNTFRLFIVMLLKANHKDSKWQGHDISRGQFISSTAKLSEASGLTFKQVRLALDKLKSTGDVATKGHARFTLYTIENYNKYQDKPVQEGKQRAGNRAGKGQAKGNKQEVKNEKKLKKDIRMVFTPPAKEDVLAYAKTRNRTDLANKFFDYFSEGNWIDAKGNKVKNWKQKFITWENNNQPSYQPTNQPINEYREFGS